MAQAFSKVRILDFSQVLAGPAATNAFAMLGADIIKIENPKSGDQFRTLMKTGRFDDYGMSPGFMSLNTGKRSLAIDLKHPRAKDVIFRLLETSDVVVENFRAGVIDKLGFGFEAMHAAKPDIIYCSISGYGQTGPKAGAPAYDGAIQAASGMMSVTGHKELGPTRTGYTVVDMSTAMSAAFAIASALYRRRETGQGQHLDVSMLDTAIWMQTPLLAAHMVSGEPFELNGNNSPAMTPTSNVFPASDGYLQITGLTEEHARGIVDALELDAEDDPRLKSIQAMVENHDAVRELFAEAMSQKPLQHWLDRLAERKVPHAPIQSYPDVLADPQLQHREILVEAPVPHGASDVAGEMVSLVGSPFMAKQDGPTVSGPPPGLGEQTDTVLLEAGFTMDDVASLRADGALG